MPALEAVEAARRTGDWNGLLDLIPYMRFLGLRVEVAQGALVGRLPPAERLVGNPALPALHGGALGAVLEAMAQLELLYRAETVVLPKTITLTVDYLRSARPVETTFGAQLIRQGRRVTTVHTRAWQEDAAKPICMATTHLLILGS